MFYFMFIIVSENASRFSMNSIFWNIVLKHITNLLTFLSIKIAQLIVGQLKSEINACLEPVLS